MTVFIMWSLYYLNPLNCPKAKRVSLFLNEILPSQPLNAHAHATQRNMYAKTSSRAFLSSVTRAHIRIWNYSLLTRALYSSPCSSRANEYSTLNVLFNTSDEWEWKRKWNIHQCAHTTRTWARSNVYLCIYVSSHTFKCAHWLLPWFSYPLDGKFSVNFHASALCTEDIWYFEFIYCFRLYVCVINMPNRAINFKFRLRCILLFVTFSLLTDFVASWIQSNLVCWKWRLKTWSRN